MFIDNVALPLIKFRIQCSKVFMSALYCHDIGQDLGCGAHLVQLKPVKSGNFSLERALSWDALQKTTDAQALLPSLLTLPEVSRLRRDSHKRSQKNSKEKTGRERISSEQKQSFFLPTLVSLFFVAN